MRSAALVTDDRLLTHRLLPVSFLSFAVVALLPGVLVVLTAALVVLLSAAFPLASLALPFVSLSEELCPFAALPSFGFSSPFAFSAGLELSFLVSLSFEGVLPVK